MMKKAALTLAAILAGCSAQNAPNPIQPAQPSITQPALFTRQPGNYALINCDYTLRMGTWGYSIECNDDFIKIKLDHSEWAPESVMYGGNCAERLFYEMEDGRAKWVDYDCDGNVNLFVRWAHLQREGYDIYVPDIIESSATEENNTMFNFFKTVIGAEHADSSWRFRHHVQPRGGN